MRTLKIVLILVLLFALVGCAIKTIGTPEPGTKQVGLSPVWSFTVNRVVYDVFEFIDRERREHCYVIVQTKEYYSGVALSCQKVEGE